MFYYLKLFFRDLWISIPLFFVTLFQLFIWFYLFANIRPSEERIFLHYNIIFGVDLIGEWWKIFYLPLVGLGIIIINYIFSFFIHKKDKFLSRLLSLWVVFIHLFLLITVLLLVRLNS